MIISWGHRRPLASTLLSLARQSSSVFSSWLSSSQVIRCCVATEVMGFNDEQSYKLLLLLCLSVLAHLPPLWRECFPIACSVCQSTPFSALVERSWLKTEYKFPKKYMCVFLIYLDILYIDFPLGLNMLFRCSRGPLGSSCCIGRISWWMPSCETFLKLQKNKRKSRAQSAIVTEFTTVDMGITSAGEWLHDTPLCWHRKLEFYHLKGVNRYGI